MNTIEIQVKKNHLEVKRRNVITSDNKNYVECAFSFDSDWDEAQKHIVMIVDGKAPETHLIENDRYVIPVSVIANTQGYKNRNNITLEIGVYGIRGEQTITSDFVKMSIVPGSYLKGKTPAEPAPDIYQEIIAGKVNGLKIEDNQLYLLANGVEVGNSVVLPTGIGITSQDALEALIETDMLPVVVDGDGYVLSTNGKMILW